MQYNEFSTKNVNVFEKIFPNFWKKCREIQRIYFREISQNFENAVSQPP